MAVIIRNIKERHAAYHYDVCLYIKKFLNTFLSLFGWNKLIVGIANIACAYVPV